MVHLRQRFEAAKSTLLADASRLPEPPEVPYTFTTLPAGVHDYIPWSNAVDEDWIGVRHVAGGRRRVGGNTSTPDQPADWLEDTTHDSPIGTANTAVAHSIAPRTDHSAGAMASKATSSAQPSAS